MYELNLLQKIIAYAIPILFAITIHEVAHGWVANRCGDPTAKMLGRLTLNPIKHIDLIGTIIVPAALFLAGGFIFGWAKPVPITWQNLKNKRLDIALVALAGPGANLIMALFWALIAKLGIYLETTSLSTAVILVTMASIGISINLILLVLNLLPIPPLDGSRVVSSFLSGPLQYQYNRLEPFGFFILILLLVTGALTYIISPAILYLKQWIFILFNLGS